MCGVPQEACAVLLDESLHYIQAKFLCGSSPDPHATQLVQQGYTSVHFLSTGSGPAPSGPFLVHRLGLVIDGRTLAYALDKSLEDKFLAVARSCRSVLCCRSTPLQKSMVVKLVRNKLKVMTLAIGECLHYTFHFIPHLTELDYYTQQFLNILWVCCLSPLLPQWQH